MPQYKNSPAGFATLRKRIIVKVIPLMLAGLIASLSISYFREKGGQTDLSQWLLVTIFLLVLVAYVIFKGIKRQREIYDSYLLTTGDDYLSRKQNGLSEITLLFSEITEITKDKYGNLLIKGQKAGQYIAVSAFLENYEEVNKLLQTVQPISQSNPKKILQKYPLLLPLIVVSSMIAVCLSNNKIIVAVSGIVFIVLMTFSFYKIRTSVLIDSRIKNKSLWILVVLVFIIYMIYSKISGR